MAGSSTEIEALGAAGNTVLDLAPELGRWLFGPAAASNVAAVQRALLDVTGTGEPSAQVAALVDASKASVLRVALARIAAEQAASHEDAALAGSASSQQLASAALSRGAPLVSVVVLLTFGTVMIVALTRTMPAGAEPVLNVLLGTLGAMATSVVGYWVGSSAGSARKDERLATIAERN